MPNHNHSVLKMHLPDEAATRALGARLARVIEPGLALYLHGDLGSGKTTLARGLLRGLGYQGRVKSPTYTLVELYTISRLHLYHFDFYRFKDPKEWRDAGFNEYFNDASVCLVEWPEKAAGLLPAADLDIALEFAGDGRDLSARAGTESGKACLHRLMQLPL
jgi:tRNA threonylcarbamoyladenosine biosynthesis protein TsaE